MATETIASELVKLDPGDIALAVGALGTAAYGIVDGFKFSEKFAASGFERIKSTLGGPVFMSLANAYGTGFEDFLRAQYAKGRSGGEVVQSLRQGVRVGLTEGNAKEMAIALGGLVDGEKLTRIAGKIETGKDLTVDEQATLSRFELALDARIDAGLALAENRYVATMQGWAAVVAVGLALVGRWSIIPAGMTGSDYVIAIVAGIIAVPIAPIAKDVAKGLQAAVKAVGRR